MKRIIALCLCLIFSFGALSLTAEASGRYIAKEGDTYLKIAREQDVNLIALKQYNKDIKKVLPGYEIVLPIREVKLRQMEKEVLRLVNEERAKRGLNELKYSSKLSRIARLKSEDLRDNAYFSHTSPTYGTPFEMMKSRGVSYHSAGENIARGQQTAQRVVECWMNSKSHRDNILDPSYKKLGIGCCDGLVGPYWTQMFVG